MPSETREEAFPQMSEQDYIDLNMRLLAAIRENDLVLAYGYVERLNAHFGPQHPTVVQFRQLLSDALEQRNSHADSKGSDGDDAGSDADDEEADEDSEGSPDTDADSDSNKMEEVQPQPVTFTTLGSAISGTSHTSSGTAAGTGVAALRAIASAGRPPPNATNSSAPKLTDEELAQIDEDLERMLADVDAEVKKRTGK